MSHVVIVGASLAGITSADALRLVGHTGPITLIGDEAHAPYARPPLSKGVLAGTEAPESVMLPALGDDVTVRVGARAARLDLARKHVNLADGERVPFDGLVIATGARARLLARPGQSGEHLLRSLDDALALRARLADSPRVLVVGAGFLGMEVASTCRALGLEVTVVDREPPLRRVLGEGLARLLTNAARDCGVRIETCDGDATLLGADVVNGIALADGRVFTADVIVSAVGDQPNVEWLNGSGLPACGPLMVDRWCRLRPDVVAAGDVTATVGQDGRGVRTPHWASAVDQGRIAASALLRGNASAPPVRNSYFWTEQFGLKIRICGQLPVRGSPLVMEGSLAEHSALLQWKDGDTPVAAATINHRMPIGKLKRLAQPLDRTA